MKHGNGTEVLIRATETIISATETNAGVEDIGLGEVVGGF
jgi:hypothetical protein